MEVNRVNWNGSKVAKVGGEPFRRFICAHAPSSVILPVPNGAVRFEAKVGLTAPKGKGSCTFKVEAGDFSRRERAEQMASRARGCLEAVDRLATYRREKNPESAAKVSEALSEVEDVRKTLAAVDAGKDMSNAEMDAAERALARMDGVKRRLMIDLNPAVNFDRLLFIRRRNNRQHLPCNWQSNSMLQRDGHDNELCVLDIRGAKRGGFTPEEFAQFNGPSCLLLDVPDTKRVYASGDTLSADFLVAHFGDAPLKGAVLEWNIDVQGRAVAP
ncbi:MAG: NPCBM/NEW2 domain-containing protein, partial [Kiritimatiellae bacterium]|nr:NPCBM/NEW2 domain-containing protein [Kiritimatiellia bacterium]